MVEFRTNQDTEQSNDSSTDPVNNMIDKLITGLEANPEARESVKASLAENYGVPPELVETFVAGGDLAEATKAVDADQLPDADTNQSPDVGPDQLIGFVDEIANYVGEDTTLGELRTWAESNKDVVATAIDMKL